MKLVQDIQEMSEDEIIEKTAKEISEKISGMVSGKNGIWS